MIATQQQPDYLPSLQAFLDEASALELAKRSLLGAPVYTIISLVMVFGTPFLRELGWLMVVEAGMLVLLGVVRVLFALGFPARYQRMGEKAVMQFSILTALQSLTLGVLAGIVIWQHWATQEAVLTIVLSAGCVAAGTSALSVRRSAHLIFLACVLGPFSVAVLIVGGPAKALLISGFLVLMAFLVQDGGQARRIYLQRLREHYDELINHRRLAVEEQARRQFLADVGHEIRTPVNSLIGLTALLQDEPLEERAMGLVNMLQQNNEALLRLVENIPGSVRTRHDIRPPQLGRLDVRALVDRMVGLYQAKAAEKNLAILTELEQAPRSVLFSDDSQLEQVLANLLINAIQFTSEGSITVSANCEATENGALRLDFRVRDTGPGITENQIERVFDPFSDGGAKTSGRYGGGGLGLPICKGLVELMNGEIGIESAVGEGTSVHFWVPAEPDPGSTIPLTKPSTTDPSSFAGRNPHDILVVDDDTIHRRVLCMQLRKLGYEPDEAADGTEAIAATQARRYDLIFMDLRMPNVNGLEATRKIRERSEASRDLRIIALTGDAQRVTRQEAFDSGVDDFLAKPVPTDVLEALLEHGSRPGARLPRSA